MLIVSLELHTTVVMCEVNMHLELAHLRGNVLILLEPEPETLASWKMVWGSLPSPLMQPMSAQDFGLGFWP